MDTKKARDAEQIRLLNRFPDLFHDSIMQFIEEVVPSHQNGTGSLTLYFLDQLTSKLLAPLEEIIETNYNLGFDDGFTEGYEEGLIDGGMSGEEEEFDDPYAPTSFFEEEEEFDEEGMSDLDEDE